MTTYGEIKYAEKIRAWVIHCEPHVSIRLKRVFGKLGKHSVGSHSISDTPENARDLEWFLERYPMKVVDEQRLTARSQEHRDVAAMVANILEGRSTPPAFDLEIPAREYQRSAAGLMLARGSLLLADDVGLGKTVSAICTFTADPIIAEVLGVKRQQIEGIRRSPGDVELVEKLQNDGSHIKRLAEAYLKRSGVREENCA